MRHISTHGLALRPLHILPHPHGFTRLNLNQGVQAGIQSGKCMEWWGSTINYYIHHTGKENKGKEIGLRKIGLRKQD